MRQPCSGWFWVLVSFLLFNVTHVFAQLIEMTGDVPKLDKVRLQLKWQHQFQFAGYYAAIAQGYYRAAGLDVEVIEAKPGVDAARVVLDGGAEFGVGTSDLILLRSKGEPVVVLASIFQHSPLVLLARRTPGVDDLQGLHDKPVMIEPGSAELFAYFKNEGIDPAKLHIEHHTFDVDDLIKGRVAAMSGYSADEPFLLKQAGIDYLTFTPRAGGIDFYGDNLFTTEAEIKKNAARVRAFRDASLRGWDYALTHIDEMVGLILRDYKSTKSREHLLFEADKITQLMHPGLIETGHMNPGRWRHMVDTYNEFGMLSKPVQLDEFLYEPDGREDMSWVYLSLVGVTVVAAGSIGWLLPLIRLNRQLRNAKNGAESANRGKSRYLAFISHEIRTPLGGIMGLVQLLQLEALSTAQRELVDLIERSSQSLLKLISGLLDHAQVEEGRVRVELVPVAIYPLIHDVCALFKGSAKQKNIRLECVISNSVPNVVLTDSLRLRQVLSNLVANAIKFTETGTVKMDVTQQNGRLRVRVADTGIGISEAQRENLFEPYMQADASIPRRFGGTGLGLAISRDLSRLLGGDITVTSEEGKGSVFTVEIVAPEVPGGGVV